MHHSSAEIDLDSSVLVPKVASFEDEGGDKFVELIDVEGSVHSGGELGGYGVVDVGDRASDTEGKGMQMNFSTWLHVRLGTLEIQNNGFTSEIFTLFDHIQPNISSQII